MRAEQRVAFIDQTSANLESFAKVANLETRKLPDMSPENQIKNAFMQSLLEEQPDSKNKEKPHWIITDNPSKFLTAAQKVLQETESKKPMKEFFGSLTILKLWTKDHSVRIDEETGIRIEEITEAEIKEALYRERKWMHPTPDS